MGGWHPVLSSRVCMAGGACVLILAFPTPARGQAHAVVPFVPPSLMAAVGVPPAVEAAKADVERARARQVAAGASPSWFVSAGASEVPEADFGKGNIRLEVGRDILTGGRRAADRAAAAADLERSIGALDGAIRRADAVLIRAGSRALGWELIRRRRVAQDSLLTSAEVALRARFGVGEARYLDVLRLRTERLRATSALATAQAEARGGEAALLVLAGDAAARRRLQAAMTDAHASPGTLEGPLPHIPDPDSLAATSPALVLAKADVRRAEAGRARELAERRMEGSAFAGIQRIGQAGDGSAVGPTLGITLSLPFLTGGTTRRVRAAAESSVRASAARAAAVEADVSARLTAAVARFAGARERVAVYDAALLRGARTEREVALAGYRAGTLSLLELLDFERALVDAEIGRLESLLSAADAWADLLDAQAGESSTSTQE